MTLDPPAAAPPALVGDDPAPTPPHRADSPSPAPSRYVVLPADAHRDAESIGRLWQRNLPEAPAERYDWLYRSGAAEGWLLYGPDGAVVGSTGLMRRRLKLFGELRPAGQAVDLNVDRGHRFATPALKLQRAVTATVADGRVDAIYGFANRQSVALLRRAGYRPLGELQRWVKPLRIGPVLRSRHGKGFAWNLAARLAVHLLGLASPETYRYRSRPGRVQVLDQFDERFDALWAAGSRRLRVVGERSADYLRWRFARAPGAPYEVLGLGDAGGRLEAYGVYRRHEGYLYLSDFFGVGPEALGRLLAELLRRARREGAEAVATFWLGSARMADILRRFGFRRRPSGLSTLVCADPRRLRIDRAELLDPENWYLTAADLDVDAF